MRAVSSKRADKRAALTEAVVAHLLTHGLGDSGVRALARAAGTSDRMLLYYFGTKDDALRAAFAVITEGLSATIEAAVPPGQFSRGKLLEALLEAGRDPVMRPGMSLWFEIIGRAMRGEPVYLETARAMAAAFEEFIASRLSTSARPRAREVLAELEGRLLVELISP